MIRTKRYRAMGMFEYQKEYLIRETLASLAARLARGQFLRTHRSYIVNLAHVEDLRPADSGVWEVRLNSGASIPLSRGYRDAVRAQVRRAAGISASE